MNDILKHFLTKRNIDHDRNLWSSVNQIVFIVPELPQKPIVLLYGTNQGTNISACLSLTLPNQIWVSAIKFLGTNFQSFEFYSPETEVYQAKGNDSNISSIVHM